MRIEEIRVPDLGGADAVDVIELSVKVGDQVNAEDAIIVVESAKATVELPAPGQGIIRELKVAVGDQVKEGDLVALYETQANAPVEKAPAAAKPEAQPEQKPESQPEQNIEQQPQAKPAEAPAAHQTLALPQADAADEAQVHAGPAVRKLAREFGVQLARVKGTGPKTRILKEDVQAYAKSLLTQVQSGSVMSGSGIPQVKLPDFSSFGRIERKPLTRMQQLTAQNMQRSWLNVPHVTQFDQADITDLEAFRKAQQAEGEKRGVKLTPLAFLLKATAQVLRQLPQFNGALDLANNAWVQKDYCHIGIAVDTPAGLVVPVIRDADSKSLWTLAEEAAQLAQKARAKKLLPGDMQGACFTITSLGGIGGTAFTPIVNAPEVAILGVSKSSMQPVWDGQQFAPRLMLPLSLSYDHRAVNGADGARFTNLLSRLLGDIRLLLL